LGNLPPGSHSLKSAVASNMGFAYLILGDMEKALGAFADSQSLGEVSQDYYMLLIATHRQAFINQKLGRLHQSAKICLHAIEILIEPNEKRGKRLPIAGAVYICYGTTLLEWNRLQEAEHFLIRGLEMLASSCDRRLMVYGYTALANLCFAQGDINRAEQLLLQAGPLWRGANSYTNILQAYMRIKHNQGDHRNYTEAARQQFIDLFQDPGRNGTASIYLEYEWQFAEQLCLVEILILNSRKPNGEHREHDLLLVSQFLEELEHHSKNAGLYDRVIKINIQKALASQALGAQSEALSYLSEALTLAEQENYIRAFIDPGPPMAAMLSLAYQASISPGYARRLVTLFDLDSANSGLAPSVEDSLPALPSPTYQPLVEPLSQREQDVLLLIASGYSNRQVAQALCISPGTAKIHTNNIYSKLGVHSRTQAVAKARMLGLLAVPTQA
jgi:LuxR family transcriptional regulator, maltose regulon positive regulatory protein